MRIAVASEKDMVTEHFGHCENFNIYDVVDGKITNKTSLANPGHRPGFLPEYLYEQGVNVIISGGMGGGAVAIFESRGIEIVVGASGKAEDAAMRFISGELKSTESICDRHEHADECH